jgi:hypothetical protein
LKKHSIPVLPEPLPLPEPSLPDYFVFSKIKTTLKRGIFQTI